MCSCAEPALHRRCFADGFDPLGLGANEERLAWFAESERVHCRWAMLGVAGILAQVRVRQRFGLLALASHVSVWQASSRRCGRLAPLCDACGAAYRV